VRLKHSKRSENQTLRLCEHFVAGTPARAAADLVGVNKNTAALFYHRLREIIAARIADESPIHGEVELDESYFGGRRKGKRGRGAAARSPCLASSSVAAASTRRCCRTSRATPWSPS
jgi:transposase